LFAGILIAHIFKANEQVWTSYRKIDFSCIKQQILTEQKSDFRHPQRSFVRLSH